MALILSRQHVLLAAVTGFISWGLLINWLPAARFVGHAFVAGAVSAVLALASLVLLTVRAKPADAAPSRASGATAGVVFLSPSKWGAEVENYRKNIEYEPEPLYPQSFVVSEAIGEILTLAARDFISSWYENISKRPVFVYEVDRALRKALGNLRDRIQNEDIVSLVVSRITPILTAHLREFDRAERAVRGRNLTRSVTESEELDLAIASKYRDGRLHPAVSVVGFTDQKSLLQDHLRKLVMGLLPQLLPDSVLNSRVVSILVREIVSCAVLLPLVTLLADPDTWNQLMETYGRSVWQDRKTVRKLRAALDEHASPNAKSRHAQEFPRLAPNDSERAFERFVRAIRRCNNLSDARRFRAQVASQLKRASMVEGQDQLYLRRLETGKRVLDQKVAKLSATGTGTRSAAPARPGVQRDAISNLQDASLVDVMHNVAGLSYFMEFMDRQQKMSLVQFWIVVDGFRNPLEDDFGDESSQSSITWTATDVNDMALINETYFHKPELNVPEESRRAVKAFLNAGKKATPEQYRKARTAILTTQSAVLEEMETKYYPKFKESDLWYKYLSSDEAASTGVPPQPPPRNHTPAPEPTERRPLPPLMTRTSSQPNARPKDLRRAAVSGEVRSSGKLFDDAESSPRQSFDSERSAPLFDDDYDTDPLGLSTHSLGSQNGEGETRNNSELIEAMGAALNDIMTNQPSNGRSEDHKPGVVSPNSMHSEEHKGRQETRSEKPKPSIASLGLVDPNARTSVFDDELFPDEKKFIEDEYADPENEEKDPADEIHEAAPGDLGLAEAIAALTEDIDKLVAQESVLDALTRKAELTNNTAELRILGKSKASIQREIRRKEMQRQQYIIQESDSSLYGRSTVQIKSIMVDKEEDGREFAIYVIEVRRQAGEQMPAATWAVARRYSEFHELHQKLRARYPSVRQLEFPRRRVMMKLQKDFLQKRRAGLETYLRQLLQLPEVCRSREFRSFLSQQSILPHAEPLSSSSESDSRDLVTRIYNSVADGMEDFLGNLSMLDQLSAAGQSLISAATTNATSSTFNPSTTTTTPSTAAMNNNDLATEDAVTAAEAEAELNAFVGEDRELEPFVKPICDLFLETFELNRGNNWLRGRAVVVVLHQLLGGTIERKVRDVARSLGTPDSLLRYVSLVRDTLWPAPERVLRPPPPRTASQRARSRNEASFMFAALIPDVVGSVVGRANAQQAARRVFALVNNEKLNLHLVLSVLDEIVLALFGR